MAKGNRNRPSRPDATGRGTKAGQFVMLSQAMIESAAYASLDLTGRALLLELRHVFKGDNNGSLFLSSRAAAARLGLSDCRPVQRAFDDLQDRGFIELAAEAHFAVKASDGSRARCWRLTWEAWPECPVKSRRAPTNAWRDYSAPGGTKESKRADKRLRALADYRKAKASGQFAVVDFTTTGAVMAPKRGKGVEDSTTLNSENDAKPPFFVVGDSTTHIDNTKGMGVSSWWAADREHQIRAHIALLNIVAQNRPQLARAA